MVSFDIKEAAEFLQCGVSTLTRKAKAGEVPCKKVGKKWVFIREHLADFVSGRDNRTRGLSVIDGGLSTQENKQWQSTNKKKAVTGTSTSWMQAANELDNLLARKTSRGRKNFTTNLKPNRGEKRN